MTFTVYGVREKGVPEFRYIGQTNKPDPILRVNAHLSEWRTHDYGRWLRGRRPNLQVDAIHVCDTRAEALAWERAIIKGCLHLGHRLFNRDHVAGARRYSYRKGR